MRLTSVAVTALVLVSAIGCRPYDLGSALTVQDGLIPAERFAKFGGEQATLVSIGRSLAQWEGGKTPEARAIQTTKAAEYARTLPGVKSVEIDTLGYRLTVTFASGWRAAAIPITDGVAPQKPANP